MPGERVDAEFRAARALARWSVVRVAALGRRAANCPWCCCSPRAPWLLAHGVTAGALVGALAYITQSLLPALQNLVHGLGTSGARLTVVLRRLRPAPSPAPAPAPAPAPGTPDETPDTPRATTPRKVPGRRPDVGVPALALAAVSFAYGPASAPVLDGLDLCVPQGGHLAVVGPSGIGKSTLTAVAAGLLAPAHGRIRGCAGTRCRGRGRPGCGY